MSENSAQGPLAFGRNEPGPLSQLRDFGEQPPLFRGTFLTMFARTAACDLAAYEDSVQVDMFFRQVRDGDGLRRGLYALLVGFAPDEGWMTDCRGGDGGPDAMHACLDVLLQVLRGCRGDGNCVMCGAGMCSGVEMIRAECFSACSGALWEMLGSASGGPVKLDVVLSIMVELMMKMKDQSRPSVVRAFGGALVGCILRCKGRPELRPLLGKAVLVLGVIMIGDSAAAGLTNVLDTCQFKDVLKLVKRELRLASHRRSTDASSFSDDPVVQQTTGDAEMSVSISIFVDGLLSCPRAWAAASAARKKFSPYVLVALVIRQPFLIASNRGCLLLSRTFDQFEARRDEAEWKQFVQVAFVDDGLYAALVRIMKQTYCPDSWNWASRLIEQFKVLSGCFYRSHQLPEQLRLGEDEALLTALKSNVNTMSLRLEKTECGAQYADIFVIGSLASTLASLSANNLRNLPSRLAVSKLKATSFALRALISLVAVEPDRVLGDTKAELSAELSTELSTGSSVSVAILRAQRCLLRLLESMIFLRNEKSKFVSSPDGALAIVSSLSSAWSIASSRFSDEKEMAMRVLNAGLPVLAGIACEGSLAAHFIRTKQAGRDALVFASSVVAAALWDETADDNHIPLSYTATAFFCNICSFPDPLDADSVEFGVGPKCALDEILVNGLLKAVTLVGGGRTDSSISIAIGCLEGLPIRSLVSGQ